MSKKRSAIIVAVMVVFGLTCLTPANSFAKVKPHTVWTVHSTKYMGMVTKGKWIECDKQPVKKGRRYKLSCNSRYSGTIDGSLNVTVGVVTAKLGFNYTKSQSFSKEIEETALKNGMAYGYYKKQYKKYKVVQKGIVRPGKGKVKYETVYVYRPIMPQLEISYKKR